VADHIEAGNIIYRITTEGSVKPALDQQQRDIEAAQRKALEEVQKHLTAGGTAQKGVCSADRVD
jgi:hypothetical protein